MAEQTNIVLSEDNYFAANAGSREICMDDHMVLLHTWENSSGAMAATTLGDRTSAVALHGSDKGGHVTMSTVQK